MEVLRATSGTTIVVGPIISDSGGITAQTAVECSSATIVDLYKLTAKTDITTTAAGANAMAHIANGYYSLVLTSGNTDTVGPLMITVNAPSSLSVWHRFMVIPSVVFDSTVAGSDYQQVDMVQVLGAAVSTSVTQIGANVVGFSANAIAATAFAANSISATSIAAAALASTKFTTDPSVMNVAVLSSLAIIQDLHNTDIPAIKVDTASSLVWIASAHANVNTVDTVVDAIKVDTASSLVWIASAHANVNTVDTVVDAIRVDVTSVLTNYSQASLLATVDTVVDAIRVDVTSVLTNYAQASLLATVDTVVDAIKVETASSLVWIASAHANIVTVDNVVDSIKVDTASSLIWIASAHANIVTVDTVVDAVKIDTASTLVNIALLPTAATINAQVLDVMNVDTFSEPGQEAPGATNTLVKKLGYVYKFLRNKITTTSALTSIYDDTGVVVDQKATVSDDGTTFTRGEFGNGA
jgi:hypothetical protein